MHNEESPLPPATFEFLVFSLQTQAEMSMGYFSFEQDGQPPEPDLGLAKHSIDLLGVLEEKTRGNLNPVEEDLLKGALTELRFRFVEALEQEQQEDAPRIILP